MKKLHIYTAVFFMIQVFVNVALLLSNHDMRDRIEELEKNQIRIPNIQIGGR